MRNGKHITEQKFPRLSNLHIIWVWMKRLLLAYLVMVLVAAMMNSGTGIFLSIVAGFLLFLSLVRLAIRFVVTLAYIILLALILGLIIL